MADIVHCAFVDLSVGLYLYDISCAVVSNVQLSILVTVKEKE